MKTHLLRSAIILALVAITYCGMAQTFNEATTPLSKKAQKGFFDAMSIADGNTSIIYKIGGDKKKNELFYESYSFDAGLKFLEAKSANEPKVETQPDRKKKYLGAYVGGSTSFDVLSMKLKVFVREVNQKWDYKRQRFVTDKVISDETVKLKTDAGVNYMGVAEFRNNETNTLLVLAYPDVKKSAAKDYVFLDIDFDGTVTEKKLAVTGAYSLVYCGEISEPTPGKSVGAQDFVLILAPKKGTAAASKYLYLHYDIKGSLKNKVEFESPSSNLLINSVDVKNGEVFFSAASTKSNEYYDEIFTDYASISNPGADENMQLMKYNKRAREEMDNFHLLKFSGNKMVFASTSKVDDFKAKKKTAPNEKAGSVYKGQKFKVQSFEVTPNNEFLITGQLSLGYIVFGGTGREAFGDVVCFHFDSKGNLKAQYAIDKIFEDKKSEIFSMSQRFYVSGDGKYAYWEILEVKGLSGYASFMDAYNGSKTFYPVYFPRITKIDLEKASLGEFKILGGKKNFINKDQDDELSIYFNAKTLTATYVGHDEDSENLWIGQATFN